MTINPDSYEPAYRQLAGIIRAAIERGELAPGQVVPSEATLVQEHKVARETARRAIGLLRSEGLVVTESGRGTFVRIQGDLTVVRLDATARISARMPSVEERRRHGIVEGVPVFVVEREGHEPEILPADKNVLAYEAD